MEMIPPRLYTTITATDNRNYTLPAPMTIFRKLYYLYSDKPIPSLYLLYMGRYIRAYGMKKRMKLNTNILGIHLFASSVFPIFTLNWRLGNIVYMHAFIYTRYNRVKGLCVRYIINGSGKKTIK